MKMFIKSSDETKSRIFFLVGQGGDIENELSDLLEGLENEAYQQGYGDGYKDGAGEL